MKRLALVYIILNLALSLFGENNKVDAKYVVTFYAKYSNFHNECPSSIEISSNLCFDKDNEENETLFEISAKKGLTTKYTISAEEKNCYIRVGTYINTYSNIYYNPSSSNTCFINKIPIKPYDSLYIATGYMYAYKSNGSLQRLFNIDYYIDIKPQKIEYQINGNSNEDEILLYNDVTCIQATKGFHPDVYKWEYSYYDSTGIPRTGPLKPFKTEDNGATIYVKGSDFMTESNFYHLVENQDYITIKPNGVTPNDRSDISLTARPSTPKINCVIDEPKCHNERGDLKIIFNRETRLNESLLITIRNLETGRDSSITILFEKKKEIEFYNLNYGNWEVEIIGQYKNKKNDLTPSHSDGEGYYCNFSIINPTPISVDIKNINNALCYGYSSGSFICSLTSNKNAKTYTLENAIGEIIKEETTSDKVYSFTNIPAGKYSITVINEDGCKTRKEDITIKQPNPITLSASTISNPKCQGSYDGVIKYNASGGTGNIKCYLQNFAHEVKDSTYSNSFSGLSAGAYYLSAKDNNSCFSDTISTFISEPEALFLSLETKNNTKKGGKSGELFATFGGGTEPYILDYAFGKTDSISAKIDTLLLSKTLPAVDTLVVLSDKNGCTTSKEFSITEPDSLKAVVKQVDFIKCYGDSTASLEIESITGGTPPYYIKWSHFDLNLEDKYKIDNLPASSYMLKVKTGYQDSIFISVDIDEPSKIKLLPSVTNTACVGEASGSILLNANGGTAPYMFYLNEQYSSSGEYNQLEAGYYNISVEDENGCKTGDTVEVKTLSDINLNVTSSSPTCYGIDNGTISISIDNGVRPYYVRCTDDNFLQVENNLELTNLEAGNYNIEVKDALGCIKTAEAILIKPEEFSFELPEKIYLCNEQSKDINIESERVTNVDWYLNNDLIHTGLNNKLTQEGVYRLDFLYDEQCHSFGKIEVDTINKKVDANFLVAAEIPINDDAHLINITPKENYEYVEWVYPTDDAWVYGEDEHSFQLVFLNEGIFQVGMIAHNDKCTASLFKTIKTFTPSGNNASEDNTYHITELSIDKSPNNGKFISYVNLSAKTNVKLYLYNASTGHIIATKEVSGEKSYEIPFSVNATAGEYILLAVAPQWQKSKWIKMIIK